jgi:hypothetical protein
MRTAIGAPSRHRPSLAPEHLGEAASVAVVAVAVCGTAVLITGVAMLVMGLTMTARYSAIPPPPDLATLGTGPSLGGAGLVVLGAALVGGAVAVFTDVRGARIVTGLLAVLAGALAAAGAVLAMASLPADPLVAMALTIVTLVFGISAILLLRPAR